MSTSGVRPLCPCLSVDRPCLVVLLLWLQVQGYCFPNELPCGDHRGCFSEHQRCDGYWHCPSGRDEEACGTCPAGEFPCNKPPSVCYPASERCNNQRRCPDGADETNCYECQPGNFHCGKRCIFEMWQCDGHEDCFDGSDEKDCLEATPREVIAAALIGSLACSLMLVIALGCAIKLCSLGGGDYRWSASLTHRSPSSLVFLRLHCVLLCVSQCLRDPDESDGGGAYSKGSPALLWPVNRPRAHSKSGRLSSLQSDPGTTEFTFLYI